MKKIKLAFLTLIVVFSTTSIFGQANPTIAVAPSDAGIVSVGAVNTLTITVGNTGVAGIAVSKLRPIITIPPSVSFQASTAQIGLPTGWTILTNTGQQLRLCNSADIIAASESRTITLTVVGVTIAPANTFTGQINFGNGTTCAAGASVSGNNTADDFATSSIEVIAGVVPLTLADFSATLKNCQPNLNWTTESEINTDRFEIERSDANGSDWKTIHIKNASGYSTSKINYSAVDNDFNVSTEKMFYRLKLIDKDGSYSYSKILPVLGNCRTVDVLVYPNPVQDGKLYISLTGTNGIVEATLSSISGQVILKNKITNGTNYLNVLNIADGIYVLNIKDTNGVDKNIKVSISH